MAHLYGGEVILQVRAELVPHRRELKLYALCRSGAGAWLISIAPFEELFFDEHLVCGLSVGEALAMSYGASHPLPPQLDGAPVIIRPVAKVGRIRVGGVIGFKMEGPKGGSFRWEPGDGSATGGCGAGGSSRA